MDDDGDGFEDRIREHIVGGRVRPDLAAASPDELLHAYAATLIMWARTAMELGESMAGIPIPPGPALSKPALRARRDRAFELRVDLEALLMPLLVGVGPLQ
jgi:hypothetical protein